MKPPALMGSDFGAPMGDAFRGDGVAESLAAAEVSVTKFDTTAVVPGALTVIKPFVCIWELFVNRLLDQFSVDSLLVDESWTRTLGVGAAEDEVLVVS